jgi:hypothetical protein
MRLWVMVALLAGCDAQVGDTYRGEPMARFAGTVESRGAAPPLPVDAALLWSPRGTATVATPIPVEKTFPAHFAMTIVLPPPLDVVLDGHAEARLAAVKHDATPDELAAGIGVYGAIDQPRVHFFEHDTSGLLAKQYGSLGRGYHLMQRVPLGATPTQAEVDACVAAGAPEPLCRDELLVARQDDLPFDTALILEVTTP